MKIRIIAITLLLTLVGVNAQTFNTRFDSKNHPKAKGAWVVVKYPSVWQAREAERPNIVQKFTGDYKDVYTVLMLQVMDMKTPVENDCKNTKSNEWAQFYEDKSAGIFVENVKVITHENKPGAIFEIHQKLERAGSSVFVSNKAMTVCSGKNMITVWCGSGNVDAKTKQSQKINLQKIEPMCAQFFNSLVLMDNY